MIACSLPFSASFWHTIGNIPFELLLFFKVIDITHNKITKEQPAPNSVIPRLTRDLRSTKDDFNDRRFRVKPGMTERGDVGSLSAMTGVGEWVPEKGLSTSVYLPL
ncbi:hypothetical protein [Parabacteroides pacaensis]|uniref:hypothetical protein n=1 Tax=Parabacteroides pacaensis TaxID=2086575 RepID=UPI000D10CBE5|nr:hypothetical protein [Parabacteroides pacaensis]